MQSYYKTQMEVGDNVLRLILSFLCKDSGNQNQVVSSEDIELPGLLQTGF